MTELTKRQREDVALVARTMAWSAGERFDDLPLSSPAGTPWALDKECFIQTALIVLGHRNIYARDYLGIPKDYGVLA